MSVWRLETADSITLCLTKSQLLFFQCFSVQTAIFQKKEEDQNVMAIHSSCTSAKRSEFMYLSPPLGNRVTIYEIKAGALPLNQEGNKVLCITAACSVANSTVTIILPLFSSRPEDALEGSLYEPSGRELKSSSLASLLGRNNPANRVASSVVTLTVSSMTEVSRTSGINPGPTPWILCLPGAPPEEYQCLSMCRYNFRDCDSYSKFFILLSHCSRLPKDYFDLTTVSTFV